MTTTKDTTRVRHSESRSDEDGVARRLIEGVAGVSDEVRDRVSEFADATSVVVAGADGRVQGASDRSSIMVAGVSAGFAMGLLTGGAHRLLVAAALVPATVVATKLLERLAGPDARVSGGDARGAARSR